MSLLAPFSSSLKQSFVDRPYDLGTAAYSTALRKNRP